MTDPEAIPGGREDALTSTPCLEKDEMQKRLSMRPLTLLGIVTIVLGLLLSAAGVRAHALLVRSLPAAGAELTSAPTTIELWFSEPLEPAFTTAYLVDAQGNRIGSGAATVDEADPMHLTLPLTDLSPGIYTVVYHNLSQADGHEWVGSFPLTLLNPDGTRPSSVQADGSAVAADVQSNKLPTPFKAFSRWVALLGAMFLAGVLAFQEIVLRGYQRGHQRTEGLPTSVSATVGLGAIIERTIRRGVVAGVAVVFVGAWLQVIAQMATLGSSGSDQGVVLDLFFQTRSGTLLFARQLLAGLLLLLTILGASFAVQARALCQWLALLLSLAILATFSLGSHAAAVAGSGWAILGDFIHLAASALWLGGLLVLALILWQTRTQSVADTPLLRQVVTRFSASATLAVFVLACTGLFSSLVQLHSVAAWWSSTYGQVLVIKVLLVGLTLGVALLNHRLVRGQRMAETTAAWSLTAYRIFSRQVWGEALIGLLVMVVVALLVQTPMPPPEPTAPPPDSFFQTILTVDDLTIHLQISPNQVGDNRYLTHLYHTDGSAIGEVQLVRLLFTHQTADLGQASLELTAQGGDLFAGAGAYQNRAGPWDVSLYVRRRGLDDLLTKTTVAVPAPASAITAPRDPWQNPIATLPAGVVAGGFLLALFLLPFIWRRALKSGVPLGGFSRRDAGL